VDNFQGEQADVVMCRGAQQRSPAGFLKGSRGASTFSCHATGMILLDNETTLRKGLRRREAMTTACYARSMGHPARCEAHGLGLI
jgi:hypothetical protein